MLYVKGELHGSSFLSVPPGMGLLGAAYWIDSASLKKVLGRSYVSLLDLQTIIVEVEAILND